MQQPSQDRSGGAENPRPPGVISLNNVQIMRPGAPVLQKSVATVTPRVIVGNSIQRPGPSSMSQEMLQNMAGPSQVQGQGHVLVKSDGRYQLVRVGGGAPMPRPAMGNAQMPGQSEVIVPMSVISAQGVQTIQPQQIAQQMGQQMGLQQFPRLPMQMQQMQMQQQMQQQMQIPQQQMPQQQMPQQQMQLPQQQMQLPQQQMQLSQQQMQQPGPVHILQAPQPGFSQATPQRIIKPPESSKDKCRNFLANLLELSSKEPPSVERNVRHLIQELIDGAVEAADFCSRLERLLNANSQPCLVGFLMKSLPMLRQSMAQQELQIPGVRPPPLRVAYPQMPAPAQPVHYPQMTLDSMPRKIEMRKPTATAVAAPEPCGSAEDDINDVAAMGGVNLADEAQRILGGAHNIGAQIRSCGEDRVIEPGVRARLRAVSARLGLAEPSAEAAQMMSAALHERLRTLLARLAACATHRQDMECKSDERYEVSQDVKGQLKFLEELDRVEKRRREESERELLLRAAKSRSKTEDPEQVKLKAKAKEMQRAEMEEVRQREANLTALQAIGPRKKARHELAGPAPPQAGPSNAPASARRSRLLRVTLRDMLHLLENDRTYAHSPILYKAYLRA